MAHPVTDLEASTVDLVKEAIVETKQLLQIEVALARDEVLRDIQRARRSAIAIGAAAGAALSGALMLLTALALSISRGPLAALIIGLVLLVLAAWAGAIAYARAPRRPMERTRARLQTDVRALKEHVA